MKIIYLANARMPTEKAHGIQIMKMCEAFAMSGHQIKLIVPWRLNHIKEDVFKYYGMKKSFKIKRIPSIDLVGLPFGFWIQSISFSFFAFFYLLFKKADIIYSRDLSSLFLISFLKKNLVYEAHTFPNNFFLYKRVCRKTKAIIVITQKLKKFFTRKGIDNNKILIAPDGVDLEKFNIDISKEECRKKLNLPLDKKIVLYTGHLYKWKGVQTLAEASKFLDKNALVIFVGGTEKDEQKFRDKNRDLDNILILGHRPYSEMPYYLKAADVLVLPNSVKSVISREWTSPMKMFEYMASQRPIVASDLPSLREVLNENNAFLIRPDNAKDLANSINQSLKNTDFSDKISKQALKDVQNYTWKKRVNNVLNFINHD